MKKRLPASILTLVFLGACGRAPSDSGISGGRRTYQFLREVGLVRMLLNTDDQEHIPPAIVHRQEGNLRRMIVRTEIYKQVLEGISTEGVDPTAVRFAKDLERELDAFKYDGLDTATLIEKLRETQAKHLGPSLLVPIAKGLVAFETESVIGAVNALLQFINDVDQRHAAEMQYVAPYVSKVSAAQARLLEAKKTILDDAITARTEFANKYPEQDWTVGEVLPQPIDDRR